jgi:transposase
METRETITLDGRAQVRLTILTDVLAGALSPEEAAMSLGCSTRQVRRLAVAYRARGAAALVHGNRGRVPANRIADERRARIVELATTTLAGFNATHVADILAEEHPELAISGKSVLRILAAAGLGPTKRRRRPRHRSRRERMPRAGMLLQADGSRHDWLEGRGPWLTLVGAVDDATGVMTGAIFREQEDAAGYFTVLAQTVARFGLPLALYTDRHGIFVKDPDRPLTLAEQLEGRRASTQLGRALETLEVRWIPASSPQAKGRSERGWGTAQDRLVSELRRARASTLAEANTVLARYLPRQAAWFGVPAADDEAAWRPWPSLHPVEAELCFHYPRRVAGDATLAWEGRDLALPRRHDGRSWKRRRVTVEEHLDGSLWVRDVAERHRLSEAPASTPRLRARSGRRISPLEILPEPVRAPVPRAPSAASVVSRPIPDHPWRRYAGPRPR